VPNAAEPAVTDAPAAPPRASGGIVVAGLRQTYTRVNGREMVSTHALRQVDLVVHPYEFVSLIGPSGCGKTTVLKIVAGLLRPTGGSVQIDGTEVRGPGADRGTVFQQPGLMPWKTVFDNVTLALEFAGVPKRERRPRAERYLAMVGLADFHGHYPRELSGGMQQRVGIARALALEPQVLLMDEPFGALDAITRHQMQSELERIWAQERKSVLFVTHSIEEALLLSDRVVVMTKGGIAADVAIPIPRPRDRTALLEDPDARRLRAELEMLL